MPAAERVSPALAAAMAREPRAPSQDRLDVLRDALRGVRDDQKWIADTDELLRQRRAVLFKKLHEDLPELFDDAGVDMLGLEPEGNLPGYDTKVKPYTHASISAEWPPEKQAAAFKALADKKADDLIKTIITIEFGRGERKKAKKVEATLRKAHVPFTTRLGVPWNTLTAWIKERMAKGLPMPPLDTIGATVVRVVELKERKPT